MKKLKTPLPLFAGILGIFALALVLPVSVPSANLAEAQNADNVEPFFRLYHNGLVNHFYTTSSTERQRAISQHNYRGEGFEGYIRTSETPGTVALYRLHHPSGNHFYTTDLDERSKAQFNAGYQFEKVAGYIYPQLVQHTRPFYRLYNPTQNNHFYTMNFTERQRVLETGHYNNEGVAGYVIHKDYDNIRVQSPVVGTTISSPLVITGIARGNWFFEAEFPVSLYDANNNLLAEGFATAQGDWMTTGWVEFETNELHFESTTDTGTLAFDRANPSGLPEHDRRHTKPIRFQ